MQFVGMFEATTLATIAGLVAAAVTVLYILKLRKRRIEVPFSPLWNAVLTEHRQQNDLWRKLRRIFSWLLHLLMVAGLAFAIADPHLEDEVVQGRHILLLVDTSASMAATDVSGGVDRLDVARQKAREILDTAGPDDRIMLVSFDNDVQPLGPFVAEASILEQPLRDLKVAATSTNFEAALAFAAASLRDETDGELVIISDGAGGDAEALARVEFGENTTVRHLKIGESADNLAITAFNVRRYLANKHDFELFVKVQSSYDRQVSAELLLYADQRLVDTKPITLPAKGVHQQFYPSQAVAGERLEARIRLTSSDARDVFPLDDRAYALLPPIERAKIEVVTDGNLYVEGPLLLNPNLDVTTTAPESWVARPDEFDAVIFDRVTPKLPERGNYFFIDPSGEHSPWESRGDVADPIVTQVRKTHPLMRWITLKDVNIGSARKLKTKAGDEVVASSALGAPILVARVDGDRRMAALSFDVRASDLPLRVAFPVLLLNVFDWFRADQDSLVASYRTGTAWSIPMEGAQGRATVVAPSGDSRDVPIYEESAVVYGVETGFHTVRAGDTQLTVAANLSDPDESRIAPGDLDFPSTKTQRDTDELIFDRSEIWVWAVLAVMLLLLLEWTTYNRRITV